jgi:hypothetical protein
MNTAGAFHRAFGAGLGVETDIRDLAGTLVIAHDCPDASSLPLGRFLESYRRYETAPPLALNIKADGLQTLLEDELRKYEIDNYFVFDMSVPDALQYAKRGLRYYTRQSEYEPVPALLDGAAGVWMDCFDRDWMIAQDIERWLAQGKDVCVVSPELHRRDPHGLWERLRRLAPPGRAGLYLCTDLAAEANRFFRMRPSGNPP